MAGRLAASLTAVMLVVAAGPVPVSASRPAAHPVAAAPRPVTDAVAGTDPRLVNLAPLTAGSSVLAVSRDGRHLLVATAGALNATDGSMANLYDVSAGRARQIAKTDTAGFRAATPDFRTVVVTTPAGLVPGDLDGALDLYALTPTGPRLIDPYPAAAHGALQGADSGSLRHVDVSVDGSTVVFASGLPIDPTDTDGESDLYRWSAATGSTTLLTPDTVFDVPYLGSDPGMARVFFSCLEDCTGSFGGQNRTGQVVERVGGRYVLRADGGYMGMSDDGARIYFQSELSWTPADADTETDGYVFTLADNSYELLTPGTTADAYLATAEERAPSTLRPRVSPDGSAWLVYTQGSVVPEDVNGQNDVYLFRRGHEPFLIPHTTEREVIASADMTAGLLATDEALLPADTNGTFDYYRIALGDDPDPQLVAPVDGAAGNSPLVQGLSADGTRVLLWTSSRLVPEDQNAYPSPYLWRDGVLTLLAPGTAAVQGPWFSRNVDAVAFLTTDALAPNDINTATDAYAAFTDISGPVLSMDAPAAINQRSLAIHLGSAGDDAVRFSCRLDGAGWTDCGPVVRCTDLARGPHTFRVRGWDAAGNVSAVTSRTFVVDLAAPSVGMPAAWFATGARSGPRDVQVRFRWPATDTGGSGLVPARMFMSTDGAAWRFIGTGSTATSGRRLLAPGHRYAVRVRSVDGAGNGSDLSPSIGFDLRAVSEASPAIAWSGAWRRAASPDFRGGAARVASAGGASASFRFTGRAVTWITDQAPSRGVVRIYLDGVLRTRLDLSAASARSRVQAFGWHGGRGTHVLRIVVVAGGGPVAVDGFAVIP